MRSFGSHILFAAALAVASPVFAKDTTIIELRGGDGARSVGIISSNEEVEASGPAAITVGDDGTIYILDQNNGRVLAVDAERSQADPEILPLPENAAPEDLAVVHNELYLWSDGVVPLERSTDADGRSQTLRAVDGGDADDYTRSVFASMGSVSPGPLNSIIDEIGRSTSRPEARPPVIQYVPSRGLGDIVAEVSAATNDKAEILLRRSSSEENFLSLQLASEGRIGTVELLDIDTTGRPYALVELVPADRPERTGMLVVRFTPNGAMDRVYDLPIDPGTVFSRRFVAIGPRGDVLYLRSQESRAQVLRLDGREPGGKLAAALPAKQLNAGKPGKAPKVAIVPKSRSDVIERAIGFETLNWLVTPAAYGRDPGPGCVNMNRLRRPIYLIGKRGQTVKGVPYCWGCKTPLENFIGGVEKGQTAGNVCTKSAPQSNVLGVDCSGFVSDAWGLKMHVSTRAIPGITKRLSDPWSMRPGDALNKPGSHVLLFMRFTDDRKVEVMEASPNACKGRVCRNTYSLGSLLMRGYQPVRFKGLDG
ncbi:hypothetical protein [Rhizobium leguminosarum]|uniref:hypothetical protein n=1 Tax=Rhizobium leguminosarum TaxID=384 RepID=UPI001C97F606|nr:hypothetical protein [Rhizobium leguminosarum]MBY5333586.1 hypothetical protein [Rhizobium leguminosarum]MBY5349170.1 hypothetical protein [Rhizobium leguminosarum]